MSPIPLISFVVPIRDGRKTVVACLQSILAQKTTIPFEIIAIDNGSSDGSNEMINRLHNSRITIFHENREGRSYARNRGIAHSRGLWIAFIDCDVVLDENWLNEMYNTIALNGLDGGQGKIIPASRKKNLFTIYRERFIEISTEGTFCHLNRTTFYFPIINSAACIFRKDRLLEIDGFDPELSDFEDIDLTGRLWMLGCCFSTVPDAKAEVFWENGGFLSYLRRYWHHGKALAKLSMFWNFPESEQIPTYPSKFLKLKIFVPFDFLRFFIFLSGLYLTRLRQKKVPIVSGRIPKKILELKILNEDNDTCIILPSTCRFFWTDESLVVKDYTRKKMILLPRRKMPLREILRKEWKTLEEAGFVTLKKKSPK